MKLSSITIRGMHKITEKTYDLSDFQYFYGKNGAGKSTVMQAIQLAMLGYIPGTDKNKSAIFKHANGPEMYIKLVIDDNGKPITIIRKCYKKGKNIDTVCEIEPTTFNIEAILGNMELPVFNFNEFIGMTANKLKDWFISFLPASDDKLDWDSILRDSISDFGKILDTDYVDSTVEYVTEKSKKSSGVQLVRDFNTYLKDQLSYYKTELARLQHTVQSLIYYEDCSETEDIEVLKSDIKAMQIKMSGLQDKLLKIEQNARLEADLIDWKSRLKGKYDADKSVEENLSENQEYQNALKLKSEQEKEIADYKRKFDEYGKQVVEINAEINEKKRIIDSNGTCPYTCDKCTTIVNMVEQFKSDITKLESGFESIKADMKNLEAKDVLIHKSYKEMDMVIVDLHNAYTTYSTLIKQVHSDVTDSAETIKAEIEKIQAQINEINDTIIKVEANKKYRELTDTITNDKYKAEQNIEILKIWIKLTDVNGLQSQLMEKPFKQLAENMSVYLKQFFAGTDKVSAAKFYLSEKANSFSFGIIDNFGYYIEYDLLSSGERCLYTLALLLSIVDVSNSPLKLIMIDDLLDHLDKLRIENCFATLYNTDDKQILLAGVQSCTHSKADEFVIEVS